MVLIPKSKIGENQDLPTFRPICSLNCPGKLFEILIKGRLEEELENKNVISKRQFGLRREKSTIQAVEWVMEKNRHAKKWCLFVAVDVCNAFNTACWSTIITRLQKIGISQYLTEIITDYFRGRKITSEGQEVLNIERKRRHAH